MALSPLEDHWLVGVKEGRYQRCAPSGASDGFYRIDTKDANLARDGAKYMGAVAVGTCVYFVPYQVSKVGVICCDGGD